MEKALFEERRRTQEEEFFRRQELSLLEKMHRSAALEAERQNIRQAAGVEDDDLARALQELGYTPETVPLVYVVPLVHVAWAEGRLTARERDRIEAAARGRGIEVGSAGHRQLVQWLDSAPPAEFFGRTLQVLRRLLDALPTPEREVARRNLLVCCYEIAGASRGVLGIGPRVSADERTLLETIEAKLAPTLPRDDEAPPAA